MPYTDIVTALPKIYSDAKVVREFFDPITYSDDDVIPLSTQLRRNYLFSGNIGQANVVVLYKNDIEFRDSLWFHRSFYHGEDIIEFKIEQTDLTIYPIEDEAEAAASGFLTQRLMQSTL